MTKINLSKIENFRHPGSVLWFEYHCNESHTSSDAPVWYRSHQQATVLECHNLKDAKDGNHYMTLKERYENACQLMYQVRFADGLEWGVFEDELLDSPAEFCRPNPPKGPPDGLNGYVIYSGNNYVGETLAPNKGQALLKFLDKDNPKRLRAELIDTCLKAVAN